MRDSNRNLERTDTSEGPEQISAKAAFLISDLCSTLNKNPKSSFITYTNKPDSSHQKVMGAQGIGNNGFCVSHWTNPLQLYPKATLQGPIYNKSLDTTLPIQDA